MTTTTDGRRREPPYPRPRVPWWLGDTLAAALVVGAAFAPFPVAGFRPTGVLAVAVVLAPVVLLPFRRRRPVPVLAAIVGLFGIAALLGTLAPGVVLATGIAVFAVAARTPRRRTIVVTVATVLAVALLGLLGVGGRVVDLPVVQFTLLVAFAAAAGDASRSRREYIEAVTERAERAERTREAEASRRVAEERLRIARDLHDAVAHQISVISLNAGVASSAIETRPEKAVTALATIRRASRTVLGEIGDLLEVLRAGDSERVASPQPGLARLDELVAGFADAGLVVSTRVEGPLAAVTGAVDLVAYRVVQEGLTNAGKHGAEHRAHVLIAVDEHEVSVVVTNPVPASKDAPEAVDVRGGYGLLGLRERVASVRGVVETGPTPGGFRLAAVLPVTRGVDVAGSSGSAGSSGGSGGAS
ncbi:sensor histidine kinase [Frigoribacterium faeni]|uniref:sensor histidine kinase n=1 Tax=Frigoribacterium faeni TaxID=145483 RepID=UPI00241305A0|nr:histidine kinase [Frigoribacterium faeni]